MLILSQDGEKIVDTTGRIIYVLDDHIYIPKYSGALARYENKEHAKWVLTDIMQCKADGYEIYYMPSSETVATRWRKF
jgi:hypothetical protein